MPLMMLSFMWAGFGLQHAGFIEGCTGALIPLHPNGLPGIFFSVFLHGDSSHLLGNSLPMAVLLFLLYQFYPKTAPTIFLWAWLGSGFLVWSLPPFDIHTGGFRPTCIIGASGMVYVLAFFLFFSGIFRRDRKRMVISLVVALYYGSMIWGMFPEELFHEMLTPSRISWQSHLTGGILGIILAYGFRKKEARRERFIWEYPNYYNEKDDRIWQTYLQNNPGVESEVEAETEIRKENIWKRLDELE